MVMTSQCPISIYLDIKGGAAAAEALIHRTCPKRREGIYALPLCEVQQWLSVCVSMCKLLDTLYI